MFTKKFKNQEMSHYRDKRLAIPIAASINIKFLNNGNVTFLSIEVIQVLHVNFGTTPVLKPIQADPETCNTLRSLNTHM